VGVGPGLIIVPVVMMPTPILPIRTVRAPGLLIPRTAPARAVIIRGTIPVSTIIGITMVRVTPYNSTNQEENQEGVLEKSCHITFLSVCVLISYTNTVPTDWAHKLEFPE
jgi:hypothetical protein